MLLSEHLFLLRLKIAFRGGGERNRWTPMWAPRRRLRRLTAYKMIEFYDCRIIPVIIWPFSSAAAARTISLLRPDDSISGQILVDGYMKR